MAWHETSVMNERIRFIHDYEEGVYDMTELCERYGISRKSGYKWVGRYSEGGYYALADRSRRPHHSPGVLSEEMRSAILSIKERFPHWGAPKIRHRLEGLYPCLASYPAVSTIGLFLKREGLTGIRRRRHRASPTETPLTEGQYANQVWCVDFKGHFRTGDGSRCHPLTVSDHASRYLVWCRHVPRMDTEQVQPHFERMFRGYGLPEVIRSDNGSPFGSVGLCGLSRLAVWWIRLGIYPERIEPGHPEQNGRHERMHKTLKAYTAAPPAATLRSQQQRFDRFREEYNEDRPHEGLSMRTPSQCYRRSERFYPRHLPAVEYPVGFEVKRVQDHGDVLYAGRRMFVSETLGGQWVGLERVGETRSLLWYCDYLLGEIDHETWTLYAASHGRCATDKASRNEEW